jgi:hypothetical protein
MTKIFRTTLVCACIVGLMHAAFGQNIPQRNKGGVRGIMDPATGVFTPTPSAVADEDAAAAAIVPTTGKLVVAFTIKLVTPLPTGGTLFCIVIAAVSDVNPTTFTLNNEISEEATTKATVSGGTATCTVTIPYSWNLTNTAKDTVDLQYDLEMAGPVTSPVFLARTSSQFVVPGAGAIKVPANGATSSFKVAATI